MVDDATMMTAIARLYYLDGLGQSEIAGMYGVSRSTVSRMLTMARDRGVVRISVDPFDPRERDLEHQLASAFGLDRALVIRTGTASGGAVRRSVGYYAAPFVADWLREARHVGVTGGRTLGELIRSVEPPGDAMSRDVVQMMGTVAASPGRNEGSELSRTLALRLNGAVHAVNTPAFVADASTRAAFAAHHQIRDVLVRAASVDLAFVGIGSVSDSMFIEQQAHSADELEALRRAGAVAEICGRYLGSDGVEVLPSMAGRVISVSIQELSSLPHVVAVTSGEGRGEAVCAVLEAGIVNGLVVDEACASAVLAAHGQRRPTRAVEALV